MQPPVSFSTPDVWIIIGSAARPFGPYLAFGSPRRCPLRTRIPPRNAVHGRHRVRHPRGVQRRRPNSTGASIHPSRSQPARPQGRAVDAASASGRSLLATAAPRFCPSLPAGSAPALVAQKQIELPAATGKRQGGLDGTRPAGGEGELGVDPSRRPHPPRRTWPRSRARVSPAGPQPQPPRRHLPPPRHHLPSGSGGQIPLPHRTRPACSRSALPAAGSAGGAHHAVASRAVSPSDDHKWRDEAPGEKKNAKPFAAFWVGITSQATSETGQSWMANARAPNQHGERKQGRSRPRTDNPPRASSYVLEPPNCSE